MSFRRSILLAVALACLSPCGCGSNSPSEVLKTGLKQANEGQYEQASRNLAKNCFPMENNGKDSWETATRNRMIKDIQILDESINGEKATVKYKIVYLDGKSIEGTEGFVMEAGTGKMTRLDACFKAMGITIQDLLKDRENQIQQEKGQENGG